MAEGTDILIRCRNFIVSKLDSYLEAEDSYDEIIQSIVSYLQKEGFKTLEEYIEFDKRVYFETFKDCRPLIGECDLCGLETIGDQPCFKAYGEKIYRCYSLKPPLAVEASIEEKKQYRRGGVFNGVHDENLYRHAFTRERRKGPPALLPLSQRNEKDSLPSDFCPPGHGFHYDLKNCKDYPFDIFWRMPRSVPANSNLRKSEIESRGLKKEFLFDGSKELVFIDELYLRTK